MGDPPIFAAVPENRTPPVHQVHLPFVNFTPFLCLLQDQQTKTPRLRDRHQRIEADAILHCCRPLWIAARRGCE